MSAHFSFSASLEGTQYQTLPTATLPTSGPVANVERVELTTSTDWMPRFEAVVTCTESDLLLGTVVGGKVQQYTYLRLTLTRAIRYGVSLDKVNALWGGSMAAHQAGWGGNLATLTAAAEGPLPDTTTDQTIDLTMMVRAIEPGDDGTITVQLASAEILLEDMKWLSWTGYSTGIGTYAEKVADLLTNGAQPDPEAFTTITLADALHYTNEDGETDTTGDTSLGYVLPGQSVAEHIFDVMNCRLWASDPATYHGPVRDLPIIGEATTEGSSKWQGLHVTKVSPTYQPTKRPQEGFVRIKTDKGNPSKQAFTFYGSTDFTRGDVLEVTGNVSASSWVEKAARKSPDAVMRTAEIQAIADFEVQAGQRLAPAILAAAPGPGAAGVTKLTARQIVWTIPEGTMTITADPAQ